MAMADDGAQGDVVLFGGATATADRLNDTWTWDGTDWSLATHSSVKLDPRSGSPGTLVTVHGKGFAASDVVRLSFLDSARGRTVLARVRAGLTGSFTVEIAIPVGATPGRQIVKAQGGRSGAVVNRSFTVS